jgi:hypothetical protein
VLVVVAWCGSRTSGQFSLRHAFRDGRVNAALDGRKYAAIGEWLRGQAAPTDSVLAYEIGAVGYFSDLRVIDQEGLITEPVARIVHDAGGYDRVRSGDDPRAMDAVVTYCVAQRPDWFLVRCRRSLPLVAGEALPEGVAAESIQNEFLKRLGDSMVLATTFELKPPASGEENRYLLLRRRSGRP